MWLLAAFITMICFGVNNMIFKWSTGKGYSKVHIQFFFYLAAFLLSAGYGLTIGFAHFHYMTIILGALIGILNANGNIQMSKAFEKGPASLTAPLIATNTVLPIVCAALIFHENITIVQTLGIVLILCSAVAIQYSPKSGGNTHYISWLIRVFLAIFSFGVLGILMKASSYLHIDALSILISMYGGGSIYLALNSFIKKEKWELSEGKIGVIVGGISIVGYSSYFFALNTGTSSIVFPIVSLNCLVVVLGGWLLFKEKLKVYQIVGVFSALIGIIFTKL